MLGSYISRTILQWKEISGNDLELYALVRHPEKLPEDARDQVEVAPSKCSRANPKRMWISIISFTQPALAKSTDHARRSGGDDCCKRLRVPITPWIWHAEVMQRGICLFLLVKSMDSPTMIRKNSTEDSYGFVDPLSPRSCYPEGKKAAETMCASLTHSSMDWMFKVARLAHTYGPGMSRR